MPVVVSILLVVIGSVTLIKAVDLFIDSSSRIAQHIGISGYTISFFLVAVATSLPEMVVGVTSAYEGDPLLSFANAVGSNIALLTLIVSIPILLNSSLSTRSILHSKDIYFTLLFALLPVFLMSDEFLSRRDGIILIFGYIMYFVFVMKKAMGFERVLEIFDSVNVWKQAAIFLGSLVLLLASSEIIVRSSLSISAVLGLSLGFVGLTITALGTSLPEIAFAIESAKTHNQQKVLGNVIGSVAANSTVVLGITALIAPFKIPLILENVFPIVFMTAALLVFINFARTREKLNRAEALLLLLMYIIFLGLEFIMTGSGL